MENVKCVGATLLFPIPDDSLEVPIAAVLSIRLLTGPVDRAGDHAKAVLHERLQQVFTDGVEIGAAAGPQVDMAPVRVARHLPQFRVQEDLPPVGQLDPGQPGILVDDPLEITEFQEPRPQALPDWARRRRTGGANRA